MERDFGSGQIYEFEEPSNNQNSFHDLLVKTGLCTDELIELLQNGGSYDSIKYRRFVEEKYSLDSQLKKIELLLNETA